jgi:hypothetical protein
MSDANPVEVPDPFPLPESAYFDRTPVVLTGAVVVESVGGNIRVRVPKHLGFKEADVLVPALEVIKASPPVDDPAGAVYVTKGFALRNNLPHTEVSK